MGFLCVLSAGYPRAVLSLEQWFYLLFLLQVYYGGLL